MAKKKTIIEENIPDNTVTGVQDGEFSFDGATETIEEIKARYGGSPVKVKVYKSIPGHKPIFQFESDTHVSEIQLQSYGGGLYALWFFVDGKRIHVEEVEVADKPVNVNGNGAVNDIQIQMLREQAQMNRDLLMAVLQRSGAVASPTPMSEIAQMWSLIHGMNPGSAMGGFDKMIELFTKGLEIGATRSGDMDWKGMLISTVKDIAPTVTNAIAAATAARNPNAPASAPQQLPPEHMLKMGIIELKRRILAGLPVSFALDWMILNAADPQAQPLIAAAVGKSFEDLCLIDNELANEPYATWVRELLAGIKQHFKEAAEVDSQEPEQ